MNLLWHCTANMQTHELYALIMCLRISRWNVWMWESVNRWYIQLPVNTSNSVYTRMFCSLTCGVGVRMCVCMYSMCKYVYMNYMCVCSLSGVVVCRTHGWADPAAAVRLGRWWSWTWGGLRADPSAPPPGTARCRRPRRCPPSRSSPRRSCGTWWSPGPPGTSCCAQNSGGCHNRSTWGDGGRARERKQGQRDVRFIKISYCANTVHQRKWKFNQQLE